MGFKTEINWVLKLNDFDKHLEPGAVYEFKKNEMRVYPIGIPIFFANRDWEILACVTILESMVRDNQTLGKFKVVKNFESSQKEILSNIYRELYKKAVE